MNTVTEDDLYRLHKRARDESNRTRYTLASAIASCGGAAGPDLDRRRVLARRIESDVYQRLASLGYTVTRTKHTEHFDLLVQGVRIEVKAATWDGARYAAAMRGNRADVLVLACVDVCTRYFVIPFDLVAGLRYIKVTAHDVRDYAGRWTPFFEAWDLVDDLVASGINCWQRPLW